jgi:hypothetical protein
MKKLFIILGMITAGIVMLVSFSPVVQKQLARKAFSDGGSPQYRWTQVTPPGSGTHQHEWKPGSYASAIVPVQAFNNELWMVGQKRAWSSRDGIKWQAYDKQNWGERISMAYAFFNNTFWVSGGMEYATNTFLNEIWSSKNGKNWQLTVRKAAGSPRKGQTVVSFKDRLWLFGGETGVDEHRSPDEFVNDVWSSTDGIHWTNVLEEAPWEERGNPQVLVFKDQLWLVGGQGRSDVWKSDNGKVWTKVKDESPWKGRHDYGLMAFDNFIWVYGGREANPRNAYQDVWFSPNGADWILQTARAPGRRAAEDLALHSGTGFSCTGANIPGTKIVFPEISGRWKELPRRGFNNGPNRHRLAPVIRHSSLFI